MRKIKLIHIYLTFTIGFLLYGCLNTEGTIEIRGRIADESTKKQIPGREIIVQGLVGNGEQVIPVDAGQFSTDSSGSFKFLLKKVKDAYFYAFCIVGDSDYSSVTRKLGLMEIKQNAKYLFFTLSRFADLRINVSRESNEPFCDTLYLSWESNEIDFRILYPYEVENYGIPNTFVGLTSYAGLQWIGKNAKSIIRTRVFADKMTKIHWELVRNKTRKEITDTITCKRDIINNVYFKF
jgi:hypothetical protein